jgi:predicted DNA-binding protein with PD1-like motif
VLRFERGQPAVEGLTAYARDQGITAARLHGIGAFVDAELGFYEFDRKEYHRFRVEEETEVLAFVGNLSIGDEGPRVHAHVTLGKRDGSAVGGHLFEGHVGATLELFVVDLPGELRRAPDEATGLPLLDL